MKAAFVLIIVAIVAYYAAVYFDAVAEQQVYAFCELNASGNTLEELQQRANENSFTLT